MELLRKLVQAGMLGKIHRFDVEEGWEFNWPLRTGHIFQARNSGVIADTGSHLFDLILWILDSQGAEVLQCKDDNWGGIEANAFVELAVKTSSGRVVGNTELSFTRRLRNTVKIYGETGCLEAATVGAKQVYFYPPGDKEEPVILTPQDAKPKKKNEDFIIQLSNFSDSIHNNSRKYVPAEETIKAMKLIEECYRSRKFTAQSWEIKHLESFFGGEKNA